MKNRTESPPTKGGWNVEHGFSSLNGLCRMAATGFKGHFKVLPKDEPIQFFLKWSETPQGLIFSPVQLFWFLFWFDGVFDPSIFVP
jgi:hypothetical protein